MTRLVAAAVLVAVLASGCASFAAAPPRFSQQASLTPNPATVVTPGPPGVAASPRRDSTGSSATATQHTRATDSTHATGSGTTPRKTSTTPTSGRSTATTTTSSSGDTDACAPPELPVVAVCLDQPWGLAPLPGGGAALVAERVTGRILRVEPGHDPALVASVHHLDSSHGGGLLGLALSPYYTEDHLIYAYATTADDARVLRIAPGQPPQPIVTGLPAGDDVLGGPIAFGADHLLYVAAGTRVLRFDAFGHPAKENSSGSAVFASGLTDPTGICPVPGKGMAVVDHRGARDALIVISDGGDDETVDPDDALWSFAAGDGGAIDCAITDHALVATDRAKPEVTLIQRTEGGEFTGTPDAALSGGYGMFHTAVAGPGGHIWLTTANTFTADASASGPSAGSAPRHARPGDDKVLILPPNGGGSGGGPD